MMPSDNFKTLFITGNHTAPFPSIDFFLRKTYNFLPKPILIQSISNSFITVSKSKYIHTKLIPRKKLMELFASSELIITHAGVGLTDECIKNKKRFLLIPRMPLWEEHCDFHQFEWFDLIKELYPDIIKINFVKLNNPKYCEMIVKNTIQSNNKFESEVLKSYFNIDLFENAMKSLIKKYN